jgi:hypothetical protein
MERGKVANIDKVKDSITGKWLIPKESGQIVPGVLCERLRADRKKWKH